MSTIAVLITVISLSIPSYSRHAPVCFNSTYPAPVMAEDGSMIDCPATYYYESPEPEESIRYGK